MITKIYHLNDRTLKYKTLKQGKRLHTYLDLPGEYEAIYPQEIVFPNMKSGRVDEYHTTKDGLLINLEEETYDVDENTLDKFSYYVVFGDYMYSKKPYLAVITHKDPKNYPEFYERAPSIYIKIHYYHFTQKELWEKYDNVINKVGQIEELTEMEALDIAFVPKFISKKYGPYVTESLVTAYNHAIIADDELRRDVGVLLGAMVIKHISNEEKQSELFEAMNMKEIENEIKILARDEYGKELKAVERKNLKLQQETNKAKQENNKVKQEITEYKKCIKKLNAIPNLQPEAKKIINALMATLGW